MEAAAISIAKSSLSSVVKLASTIINDEIGLLLGLREELFFIKEELEMIQSFLRAASAEKVRGETVITWVKQVQELAYDVEDCLQEASVSLMKNNCLPAWCSVKERDSIARKIRSLKVRIEDVSKRNLRYSLVKSLSSENNNPVCHQVTPTRLTANDEALLVGLEGPSHTLVKLIRKESKDCAKHIVISVVGMGGLGKTTLVRKVCQGLRNEFQVAWVNVLHPFHMEEFIESLFKEILIDTPEDGKEGLTKEGHKIEELKKKYTRKEMVEVMKMSVSENLKNKKYIIVLDDLSSKSEWDEIENVLPKSAESRIIVTTREKSLAKIISHSSDHMYEIKPLSEDHAKDLFFKAVYKTSNYFLVIEEDPSHESKSNQKNDPNSTERIEKEDENEGDTTKDPPHESKSNPKNDPSSSEIIEKKNENNEDTKNDPPHESKSNLKNDPSSSEIIEKEDENDGDTKKDPLHESKSNPKNDLSSSERIEKEDENDGDMKKESPHESKSNSENDPSSSERIGKEDENDEDTKKNPPHKSKLIPKTEPGSEVIEEHSELQNQSMKPIRITKDMETQASLIRKKCDGLPIAIITIGSYLATKPKTSAKWKALVDHLSSELESNPNFGKVKTVISSSYDGMPYHLKSCLLYLSVFHNHQEIRRTRIIRRWMADGYVIGDHNKTGEELGKGYFYDLMGRSLIQPSQTARVVNGQVPRCDIHDVMYELILQKSNDEKVVSLLKNENLITKTDKVRHLVITSGECEGEIDLAKLNLSHMRSLSIFGKVGGSIKNPRMKLLRVLDLEGTIDLDNRDLKRVGILRHLKYLGLRGTKITKLPKSLRKLHDLETLDIRNTVVLELPQGVTELRKLGYLRSGFDFSKIRELWESLPENCCFYLSMRSTLEAISNAVAVTYRTLKYHGSSDLYGVWVPPGIRKLKSLTTLGTLNVYGSNGLVKELQHLINLRKLALTGFFKKNGKTLAKVIDRLKHLRSLVLEAEDDEGLFCCLQNVSSPPKYLQSLKLYSPIKELPDWIKKLENLVKMELRHTELKVEEIKKIEMLPNLTILYLLRGSFCGEELCFGHAAFPKLQTMIIDRIYELTKVSFEENMLMSLENLEINRCKSLGQGSLSGLHFLVRLKKILVKYKYYEESYLRKFPDKKQFNENNQALVRKLKDEISRHRNKPNLMVMRC